MSDAPEHNHFVFIPRDIFQQAMKMPLKREVKFILSAWSFASVTGEPRTIKRKMVMKTAGMYLGDAEFLATLKSCRDTGLMPEGLEIL